MEISSLLSDALSTNDMIRKQAEANIEIITAQDYGGFLLECGKELANEGVMKGIRQIAATLIKNLIVISPNHIGKWALLPIETKSLIKKTVLSTLASGDKDIRKAAALAVAGKVLNNLGICKLDVPNKEWPEIIKILCDTCLHENRNFKLSSIITLNYISQEVQPKDLSEEEICCVLQSLYLLLDRESDEEILENSIKAMLDYIPYLRTNFQKRVNFGLILGKQKPDFGFNFQVIYS
jgi:hypothetical protein